MAQESVEAIMQNVAKSYDTVAIPFAQSRVRDWKEFELFLPYLSSGAILDAGCAHGRLVPFLQNHGVHLSKYQGIDISSKLITLAQKEFPELLFEVGNVCELPYAANSFDTTISSAVLHHIPSRGMHAQCIAELIRVTKPGGHALMLVWNAYHFKHLRKYIFWSYVKAVFSFGKNRAGDMTLPFFGKTATRFVHAFTERELRQLLEKTNTSFTIQTTGKNFFIAIKK